MNNETAAIARFKAYITGDFDNQNQVEQAQAAGQQAHPLAVHVNRIADHKVKHAPARTGFWLIEESYYTYPDGTKKINHHLFFFEGVDVHTVRLYAYELPAELPMHQLTNDNPDLSIDFNHLRISTRFQPAAYAFDGTVFTLHAPNHWDDGMTFTLIETIAADSLTVMELLEKNGQRLTPYATPIVYDRKPSSLSFNEGNV